MVQNSTSPKMRVTNLSVIRKSEKEHSDAKVIPIKKEDKKNQVMLPPPQEQYIKAKKHDFL
jgi:hypothetical protein